MEKTISIGSVVHYKTAFGQGPVAVAIVTGMERTEMQRAKYGTVVASIPFNKRAYGVYELRYDNRPGEFWCYGTQIIEVS